MDYGGLANCEEWLRVMDGSHSTAKIFNYDVGKTPSPQQCIGTAFLTTQIIYRCIDTLLQSTKIYVLREQIH